MKNRIASLVFVLSSVALPALPALAANADVSSTVSPAGKSVGLGVELGAPTGLNVKLMLSPNTGVVFGVGGGIWYDESLALHADYLWHPLVAQFNDGCFSGYVGGGGWTSLRFGGDGSHYGYYQPYYGGAEPVAFGARLPLGLTLAFNQVPVEAFVEVAPSLEIFPGIGVFGQGGIGARFYF